ncbi:DUF1292 domain-containing protein [Tenuibacillus multivorans]|uniref:DUF1292 domain-containing protein n=1 Tax=Tenuibacillus multivorans TaxID=237069 RepID=A0A1H0CML7_9BACI|nr:DUF1292 domain-containing protein [Tenuibacillus multivorans]GEL76238.1 hypothetical protein TMU01_04730 [Tenuibacillus multivorans]SDN59073.1 Protein of unknown function [Tenuibacillus multivorans]
MNEENRDVISIENEHGEEREMLVEALFDMEGESYALLKDDNETFLMRIENEGGEQYLVQIEDPEVKQSILDAYEIAVDAATGDNEDY